MAVVVISGRNTVEEGRSQKRVDYAYYGSSDKGLVRDSNEDVWGALGDIFLLADGIGGRNAGEVAAKEAVDYLADRLNGQLKQWSGGDVYGVQNLLREAIQETNRFICQLASKNAELYGMGTTLCCLVFVHDYFLCAHVGDSRIYRLRDGKFSQLTEDHSLATEMVARGELHPSDVATFPQRHVITRSIGIEWEVEPSLEIGKLEKGDRYLLCSDGLSDEVSDERLSDLMSSVPGPIATVNTLVEAAKEAGGRDNITAVVVDVEAVYD